MDRRIKVEYSEERPDMALLMRLLCEAVHSCYENDNTVELPEAA